MIKQRFEAVASSLGSYFGVGFNTPEEQLMYDLGIIEQTFDEQAEDRMNMGRFLEDGMLNYFESALQISITDRNVDVIYAFDGRMRCKIDGRTIFQGVETGVEAKYSNSSSGKFTEDKGYYLQCQAYMEATGLTQWLLVGFYQGKPIHKLIYRDERIIGLLREMVDFLFDCFSGLQTPANFPYHLLEQYNPETPRLVKAEPEAEELALIEEFYALKQEIKDLESKLAPLEAYIKNRFADSEIQMNSFKITVTEQERAGAIDVDLLLPLLPADIDFKKYSKPSSRYQVIRVSKKK